MWIRQFISENGLLVALLAGSVVGHWSLSLWESPAIVPEDRYDTEQGRTTVAVYLVAAQPKSEVAVEDLLEKVDKPVETKPLETPKTDPSVLPIRRREISDPILSRQTPSPGPTVAPQMAAATPPKPDPTEKTELPDEPITRPKPAKRMAEQKELDVEVDVTFLGAQSSGVEVLPTSRVRVQPLYPAELQNRKIEGQVMMWIDIDAEGKPTEVRIEQTSGYESMDRAALDAVRRWTFYPAMRGGVAVRHQVTFPVRFFIRGLSTQ